MTGRSFVKPEELAGLARAAGLRMTDLTGMTYRPAAGGWVAGATVSVNYIAAFVRA